MREEWKGKENSVICSYYRGMLLINHKLMLNVHKIIIIIIEKKLRDETESQLGKEQND